MTLGEKLQTLRSRSGLSQEELAEQLGVSRQAVSKWELDKTVPEVRYIVSISGIFGVTTDFLLKEDAGAAEPAGSPGEQTAPQDRWEEPPDLLADRAAGLPVWHGGRIACRALVLGNVLSVMLLGLYLAWALFGFGEPGAWPLILVVLLLPVLAALGKLLLESEASPERVRRRFRRDLGAAAALWGFAAALLLGFHEVLEDTLTGGGVGSALVGLLLAAAILAAGYLLGYALGGRLTRGESG